MSMQQPLSARTTLGIRSRMHIHWTGLGGRRCRNTQAGRDTHSEEKRTAKISQQRPGFFFPPYSLSCICACTTDPLERGWVGNGDSHKWVQKCWKYCWVCLCCLMLGKHSITLTHWAQTLSDTCMHQIGHMTQRQICWQTKARLCWNTCVLFFQLCLSQRREVLSALGTLRTLWCTSHILGHSPHETLAKHKVKHLMSRSFYCRQMPQKLHHSLLSSASWWIKQKKMGLVA